MSGDLSQLMARAQEAQQKLQALQQELATRRVEQDIAVKVYEEPRVLGGEATLTVSVQLVASCGN